MSCFLGRGPEHVVASMIKTYGPKYGTPVFTYSVNVTNGQLELDFGPDMAGKEIGLDIEEN